ncbi:MAG: ImmA/IrrE family metallo-endopeptidase [Clostridiales bacterium]|nr:ImmA/IrrE family metallo-endopeptidase [Clostridiales bacterium]
MALDNEMKQLINDMAGIIIRLYNIDIPISDIVHVVNIMGGEVIEDPSIDGFSDGRIRKTSPTTFEIAVSPFQTEERRNFTIAHELGHLFLHMGFRTNEEHWRMQDNIPYYRNGSSELEYQSNEFAAAFLMPPEKYKQVMDENTEGNLVNTYEVARYFNVSVDAAANRGKWLGYLKW